MGISPPSMFYGRGQLHGIYPPEFVSYFMGISFVYRGST
jgi:hypothetical protein